MMEEKNNRYIHTHTHRVFIYIGLIFIIRFDAKAQMNFPPVRVRADFARVKSGRVNFE